MVNNYTPKPGERYLAVKEELCLTCPDCVPVRVCPVSALLREPGQPVEIDYALCLACGSCLKPCAPMALSMQRG